MITITPIMKIDKVREDIRLIRCKVDINGRAYAEFDMKGERKDAIREQE